MLSAMQDLERTWNHKFNYPWTFFNDVPFSAEFKEKTQAVTKAECRYGTLSDGMLCEDGTADRGQN
jgi:mannosyltransferase